jgi:hypothetical protein
MRQEEGAGRRTRMATCQETDLTDPDFMREEGEWRSGGARRQKEEEGK